MVINIFVFLWNMLLQAFSKVFEPYDKYEPVNFTKVPKEPTNDNTEIRLNYGLTIKPKKK